MSDELRDQIHEIIEADIQNGINDYIEKEGKGFKGQQLTARVAKDEVDKIMKQYKQIKKAEKSNLNEIKKIGLVDKNGRTLDGGKD